MRTMDQKYKTLIPLIIIFFIFGAVVGYLAHQPATTEKIVEKTVYINRTIEVIKEVTPTPVLTAPTPAATLEIQDFTVKSYDPSIDIPSRTIELTNWRANPDTLTIHPGDSVLFKITDSSLQSSMTFILNRSYTKDLGTTGFAYAVFNKKGTYNFESIIPSSDPTIDPRIYAQGTITVY